MKAEQIEIGKTYRMKGRKLNRRVIDVISRPVYDPTGEYAGEYRVAIIEILGGSSGCRRVKEYLPWMAHDAIGEVC